MTRRYRFEAYLSRQPRPLRWSEEAESVTEAVNMAVQTLDRLLSFDQRSREDVEEFCMAGSSPI